MKVELRECPNCGAENLPNRKQLIKFKRTKPQKGNKNGASLTIRCEVCGQDIGPYYQTSKAGKLQKESFLKEGLTRIWNFRPELERCPKCGGKPVIIIESPYGEEKIAIDDPTYKKEEIGNYVVIRCKECGYELTPQMSNNPTYFSVIPLIVEAARIWNMATSIFRGPKFVYPSPHQREQE